MGAEVDVFSLNYLKNDDVMVGVVKVREIDKPEASKAYDYFMEETAKGPDFSDFVLDVSGVAKVSNSSIGILMKALDSLKRGKSLAILVMTEELLREIMLQFPEMFDYYAVFHTMEDAVTFARKRRTGS